jgi:hypothetical protein
MVPPLGLVQTARISLPGATSFVGWNTDTASARAAEIQPAAIFLEIRDSRYPPPFRNIALRRTGYACIQAFATLHVNQTIIVGISSLREPNAADRCFFSVAS